MAKGKKKASSSSLQSKAKGGFTVSMKGGGGFDKSDMFIGLAGIFVLVLVVVLGRKDGDSSTTTSVPLRASRGTTTVAAGDTTSASVDARMSEVDGKKFKIGEALMGHHGGMERLVGEEFATASDLLEDVAKKKKENFLGKFGGTTLYYDNGQKEFSVAEDLAKQAKELPRVEAARGSPKPGQASDQTPDPSPLVNRENPFDLFEGAGEYNVRPWIDSSGYGHTVVTGDKYTDVEKKNKVYFPRFGEKFVYDRAPNKYPWTSYGLNNGSKQLYHVVAEQNEMIQKQRNMEGFDIFATGVQPEDMRREYPNDNFLPQHMPQFFPPGGKWAEWQRRKNARALRRHNAAPMSEYSSGNEHARANELGETGHSFTDSNPKSGLDPSAQRASQAQMEAGGNVQGSSMGSAGGSALDSSALEPGDPEDVKTKVRASVVKVLKLFDRLFSEELFPDAVVEVQEDDSFRVTNGKQGKCILLARYYEYVQNAIQSTLNLGQPAPLTWAKGVDLNFGKIQENLEPLRTVLTQECSEAGAYTMDKDGVIKTLSGKVVAVDIPWPKDQTTLVNHPMTLG